MHSKKILFALCFPLTMPAMEEILTKADNELQHCKAKCEKKFNNERPFCIDDQDDEYKANIALQNKNLCHLECLENYRAFVALASKSKDLKQDK